MIQLEDVGEATVVKAQCRFTKGPGWQPMHPIEFRVPAWAAKAYYIGKPIRLTVTVG